jgi:hypothetical protein
MDYKQRFRSGSLGSQKRRVASIQPPESKRPEGSYDYLKIETFDQTLRVVRGDYAQEIVDPESGEMVEQNLAYLIVSRHYDPTKNKYCICSAGNNPYKPKPCVGCTKGLRKTPLNVFTTILLETFHKVPWEKDGKNVIRNNKPVMIDKLCDGTNCKMCAVDAEVFFGKRLHWAVNQPQMEQVIAQEETLKGVCECGQPLKIKTFNCPLCEDIVLDLATTDLSGRAIKEAFDNGMWCGKCNRIVYPYEISHCPKADGGCDNSRPLDIFKVNTVIKKVPVPKSDNFTLQIAFSRPCGFPEEYKGETAPMDLHDIFKPPSIATQRGFYGYGGAITNVNMEEETEEYHVEDK